MERRYPPGGRSIGPAPSSSRCMAGAVKTPPKIWFEHDEMVIQWGVNGDLMGGKW